MADNMQRDDVGSETLKVYFEKEPIPHLHWHRHNQIILVVSGNGRQLVADREFSMNTGDVVIVPCMMAHNGIFVRDTMETLYISFFDGAIAPIGASALDYGYLQAFRYPPDTFENVIPKDAVNDLGIGEKMLELNKIYESDRVLKRLELYAELRVLLTRINRYYALYFDNDSSEPSENSMLINRALAFINDSYLESISLNDITELLHVSPSRFREIFKKQTQLNFKEYVLRLRISKAKELLLTTDSSVVSIAQRVNISNITFFYATFNRLVEMSPAEYRKRYQSVDKTNNTYI